MLVVLLVPVVSDAQSRASQPSSPNEVIIDGAKNPELFPEWFVWEHTLLALDEVRRTGKAPLDQGLRNLSKAEWVFIQQEMKSFQELRGTLEKQLPRTKETAAAAGKTEDQIRDATHLLNLDYRHKVLDIAQRVSERLSPESLTHLRAWMSELIGGTTVSLRGRAIKFFSEPR